MAEYIERNGLLEWVRKFYPEEKVFASAVINAPTANVQEVRHGEWKERQTHKNEVYCSECATIEKSTDTNYKSPICPNCGAKMDKEWQK